MLDSAPKGDDGDGAASSPTYIGDKFSSKNNLIQYVLLIKPSPSIFI